MLEMLDSQTSLAGDRGGWRPGMKFIRSGGIHVRVALGCSALLTVEPPRDSGGEGKVWDCSYMGCSHVVP